MPHLMSSVHQVFSVEPELPLAVEARIASPPEFEIHNFGTKRIWSRILLTSEASRLGCGILAGIDLVFYIACSSMKILIHHNCPLCISWRHFFKASPRWQHLSWDHSHSRCLFLRSSVHQDHVTGAFSWSATVSLRHLWWWWVWLVRSWII